MASKEQGRDPKTKWGLAKTQGEAGVKTSVKEMSSNVVDIRAQMQEKEPAEQWLFTKEQLQNTPSRKDKVTVEKELIYRQQAANLIQDMGQRLLVDQLTINTAIVYMHRFYMFHSFQAFSRFVMAPTALFLAAKVEEQPRKLEHVIKVYHSCMHADKPHLDVHSDNYLKQAQELVKNELIMLQAIGFDISIDHPHTHVVKCTQLVKASRDLSQMADVMATHSLHLTTFCLKYKPTVVSAMCIHLSCKWSNYEIPLSSTGKAYWTYMDPTITEAMLENIINEFLQILNLCPTRLRKLKNYKPSAREGGGGSTPSSKDGQQSKPNTSRGSHPGGQTSQHPTEVRQPVSSQSDGIKVWLRANYGWYYAAYEVFLVLYIVLVCVDSVPRKHPTNLIMLGLFTLALSYMTGTIAAFYDTQAVVTALGLTVIVCVAVILFSIQTKFDFTKCSGLLFVLVMVLFLFGFITIFTWRYNWYLQIVYGCLGALVFTLFLAFDTQLVMGGRKHQLDPEEYVYGALTLYIDVVYIFLFILAIFGIGDG